MHQWILVVWQFGRSQRNEWKRIEIVILRKPCPDIRSHPSIQKSTSVKVSHDEVNAEVYISHILNIVSIDNNLKPGRLNQFIDWNVFQIYIEPNITCWLHSRLVLLIFFLFETNIATSWKANVGYLLRIGINFVLNEWFNRKSSFRFIWLIVPRTYPWLNVNSISTPPNCFFCCHNYLTAYRLSFFHNNCVHKVFLSLYATHCLIHSNEW